MAKSAVKQAPAVFDEAAYMKRSMDDAMEQIRLGNYKPVIGGGGRQNFGFRDTKLRDGHFKDHGEDFGATSAEQYEKMADNFMTNSLGKSTLEKVRANGDIVRYDTVTEEF
jgi:hypothetical protein